jgi:4-amino-4-deoxy-L-arabinose transferase-like glycosyltransferase
MNRIGRTAALAALLFGAVLTVNGIANYDPMDIALLVVVAGLLSMAGGVAFLAGLDFGRGRAYRIAGWVAFTLGFLLPTSLIFLLVPLSLLALPAALRND